MWPHLTPWVVLPMIGLRALWLTPDWLLKLLAVAEAVRRYRSQQDDVADRSLQRRLDRSDGNTDTVIQGGDDLLHQLDGQGTTPTEDSGEQSDGPSCRA
jgi:hypothetical protein